MLEGLSPHCVAKRFGFGAPLYSTIKICIGIIASAPQAQAC
jgi:hypothetical protein